MKKQAKIFYPVMIILFFIVGCSRKTFPPSGEAKREHQKEQQEEIDVPGEKKIKKLPSERGLD